MKHVVLVLIWIFFSTLPYKPVLAQVSLLKTTEMLESVDSIEIGNTIKSFSEFETRYYRSPEAIKAQEWLKSKWEGITQNRDDVHVDFFHHPEDISPMPSIILTIEGSVISEEKIVLGAHADSESADIAFYEALLVARSPGADDNASGIATITEVLRILMLHNYRPTRTIMFMAYAAEEVRLRGSDHIAKSFALEDQKVIGTLNLDMTNFRGSEDLDLVIIADNYTSLEQNTLLEQLLLIYLPEIKWEYGECGDYGCSDYASWHRFGFPASMLTEARFHQMTPHIHKITDTFESLGNNAEHSVNFVKLSLAFLTEIDRFGMCRYDSEKCN